jgi:hypothetical protein
MKPLIALLFIVASVAGADFSVGVARANITPKEAIVLAGYLSSDKLSEGVIHDLWGKAVAFQDAHGRRAVIVTTDLIGLPRVISDEVAARVQRQYGVERAALLLNSSHNHAGPLLARNQYPALELSEYEGQKVEAYRRRLTDNLVSLVGAALAKLERAQVSFGEGNVGFAVNRRQHTAERVIIGVNKEGPTDHSVPVLKVTGSRGQLIAVVFGYSCHNTSVPLFNKIYGDYAGFAQIELEKVHPGATAMFLMLCGGDQNPYPRGTLDVAERHGKTLAREVDRVLSGGLRPVKAPIHVAYEYVEPGFDPYPHHVLEESVAGSNILRAREARFLLRTYEEGRPIRRIPYPIQVIRFDRSLTLVALGGEVVVDYAIRIKREYTGENIVVAGYSNDVMAYIPSLRVLKEGGYEADGSGVSAYGLPGPFNEKVEEIIFEGIRRALRRVGRSPVE